MSARERARRALSAALAPPAGSRTPKQAPRRSERPAAAAQAPLTPRRPPERAASRRGGASVALDDVADELAAVGVDLPASLTPEERRATILDRLSTPRNP
jgi:hypothetical protein